MKNLTLFRAIETPSDPPEDHIILCGFGEVGFEEAGTPKHKHHIAIVR